MYPYGLSVVIRGWRTVAPCSDYRHMPELDRYDADGIDENENLEELSDGGRLAVEQELDRRDRRARGELPAAFEGSLPLRPERNSYTSLQTVKYHE